MQTFIEKFREVTDGRYDFLKLQNAEFVIDELLLSLTFAYPEEKERDVFAAVDDIKMGIKRAFDGDIDNIDIKFVKSHFDREFFLLDIMAFIKQFPMLATMLTEKDILTHADEKGIRIVFRMNDALCDYCNKKSAGRKIEEHIKNMYCENIDFGFEKYTDEDDDIEDFERELEEEKNRFTLENLNAGRVIQPQNVEEFIGKIIYEKAAYIEDVIGETDRTVLCGVISGLRECAKKDNPNRKFYKFTITDPTDKSISCLYFPNKKTENQITLLKDGKSIVGRGKITEDQMRHGSFTFWPNDISFCTLPADFKINRIVRKVDDVYHTVFPQPYVSLQQTTLFDVVKEPTPYLRGKTFCVFDLETTGFKPESDRIIEIGAVRIVDGKFVDTFNTYIDPKMPIPEKITDLTGIRDSDVMGQPSIEDVLPDFYKYSDGTILVGQNVQFDYGFISVNGARQNIYFENEMEDTVVLGRKYIPDLKKYKLANLTRYFNIVNQSAHRGIYDALATAEVFIRLAELMDNAQ